MEFVDTSTPSMDQYMSNVGPLITPKQKRAAYQDYLQMYVPNAYNTAVLNYMNEYNLPVNQMLRYQQAGINPYAVAGNMSATSAEGKSGQASSYSGTSNRLKSVQNAISSIDTSAKLVATAKEMYDYLKFGREASFANSLTAGYNAEIARLRAESQGYQTTWDRYWNTGQDTFDESGQPIYTGQNGLPPRARYMQQSTEEKVAHIAQLEALVTILYPSQAEAAKATAALNDYKKQVMEGQSGAILSIDTGNETRDSILKLIAMWLLRQ